MHWDHEPLAVLCRTESVDKSDALQTLRVACRVRGPRDSVWTVCAFSAARPRQATIQGTGTIAWIAMSVEMLRLTAHPIVADELELSTLNSVLGLHSPNGRWVTFNTPMDGTRKASAHDIVFQAGAAWA